MPIPYIPAPQSSLPPPEPSDAPSWWDKHWHPWTVSFWKHRGGDVLDWISSPGEVIRGIGTGELGLAARAALQTVTAPLWWTAEQFGAQQFGLTPEQKERVSGQQLLQTWTGMGRSQEGIFGLPKENFFVPTWSGLAGFAAEIATDPLTYTTLVGGLLGRAGRTAKSLEEATHVGLAKIGMQAERLGAVAGGPELTGFIPGIQSLRLRLFEDLQPLAKQLEKEAPGLAKRWHENFWQPINSAEDISALADKTFVFPRTIAEQAQEGLRPALSAFPGTRWERPLIGGPGASPKTLETIGKVASLPGRAFEAAKEIQGIRHLAQGAEGAYRAIGGMPGVSVGLKAIGKFKDREQRVLQGASNALDVQWYKAFAGYMKKAGLEPGAVDRLRGVIATASELPSTYRALLFRPRPEMEAELAKTIGDPGVIKEMADRLESVRSMANLAPEELQKIEPIVKHIEGFFGEKAIPNAFRLDPAKYATDLYDDVMKLRKTKAEPEQILESMSGRWTQELKNAVGGGEGIQLGGAKLAAIDKLIGRFEKTLPTALKRITKTEERRFLRERVERAQVRVKLAQEAANVTTREVGKMEDLAGKLTSEATRQVGWKRAAISGKEEVAKSLHEPSLLRVMRGTLGKGADDELTRGVMATRMVGSPKFVEAYRRFTTAARKLKLLPKESVTKAEVREFRQSWRAVREVAKRIAPNARREAAIMRAENKSVDEALGELGARVGTAVGRAFDRLKKAQGRVARAEEKIDLLNEKLPRIVAKRVAKRLDMRKIRLDTQVAKMRDEAKLVPQYIPHVVTEAERQVMSKYPELMYGIVQASRLRGLSISQLEQVVAHNVMFAARKWGDTMSLADIQRTVNEAAEGVDALEAKLAELFKKTNRGGPWSIEETVMAHKALVAEGKQDIADAALNVNRMRLTRGELPLKPQQLIKVMRGVWESKAKRVKGPFEVDPSIVFLSAAQSSTRAIGQRQFAMGLRMMGAPREKIVASLGEKAASLMEEIDGIPEVAGYLFPKQLAAVVKKERRILQSAEDMSGIMGKFGRAFATVNSVWRDFVINFPLSAPAYNFRNFISDTFNSFLGGGFSLKGHSTSARIMSAYARGDYAALDSIKVTLNGTEWTGKQIIDEARRSGVLGTGQALVETPAYIEKELNFILKHPKLSKTTGVYRYANMLTRDAGRALAGARENISRMGHFITRIDKGDDKITAANSVFKHMFDYADLAAVEAKVVRGTLLPFYTFRRKNVALQLSMLFEKPWAYLALLHAKNCMEGNVEGVPAGEIPQWLQDKWMIRSKNVNGQLGFVVMDSFLPMADLVNPGTFFKNIVSQLGPIPKTLVESLSGTNTFTGRTIQEFQEQFDTIDIFGMGKLHVPRAISRHLENVPAYTAFERSASGQESPGQQTLRFFTGFKEYQRSKESLEEGRVFDLRDRLGAMMREFNKAKKTGDISGAKMLAGSIIKTRRELESYKAAAKRISQRATEGRQESQKLVEELSQ